MRKRLPLLAGSLLLALTLGACAGPSGPSGTWGNGVSTDKLPYLQLFDGGLFSGSDGCNRLLGGWKANGDKVTFGPVSSTQASCPDVDTWLSKAATASIDGNTLTVFDQGGTKLGTLDRQG
ncbi:META domain-containing protein [Specibacter cremeus]|uniref:META domain-containing protein n=1 Tax=Specibacter cremeus TaxID=1629051 RepID=UPI000F774E9F|nr:META domain-containing protein [Specibacter cremeus]